LPVVPVVITLADGKQQRFSRARYAARLFLFAPGASDV
jgi:hypothetical protein